MAIQVSGQILKYIPDTNLRKELTVLGCTTRDSLDIQKIQGRLQLELSGKGIVNLEGLQYFPRVWRLIIVGNKIKRLTHLPPELTMLDCSDNQIERIDSLPQHLQYLSCKNNNISTIGKLPFSMISLGIQNNKLTQLPLLPKSVQEVNYFHNPIHLELLPKNFKEMPCVNSEQNCLPYDLIHWDILNVNSHDTSFNILGLKINIYLMHGWGFGTELKTYDFEVDKYEMVSTQIRNVRVRDCITDTVYSDSIRYRVNSDNVKKLIIGLMMNRMNVSVQHGESNKVINIAKLKNGHPSCEAGRCFDCGSYTIEYLLHTDKGNIKLSHLMGTDLKFRSIFCDESDDIYNLKILLDYLYNLNLQYLVLPEMAENEYARHVVNEIIDKLHDLTSK